jgi:hypothetical protein
MKVAPSRSSTVKRPLTGWTGQSVADACDRPRLSIVAARRRGKSSRRNIDSTVLRPNRSARAVCRSKAFVEGAAALVSIG